MLLDDVRNCIRLRQYSRSTEAAYVHWIRRYILFHDRRHPRELGGEDIRAFLTYLARREGQSRATQRVAFSALLFLYRRVLHIELPEDLQREVKPRQSSARPPSLLSRPQLMALFANLEGEHRLIAKLLYGSGIRLAECLRLRVTDLDFERGVLSVVDGKGGSRRISYLPRSLHGELRAHLQKRAREFRVDAARGEAAAPFPSSYNRKNPAVSTDFRWQFVFGSERPLGAGGLATGRWHINARTVQRAIAEAARKARIPRVIGPHTLRHSFATHHLEAGANIRQLQLLMGHKQLKTTLIYTHVVDLCRDGSASPLDRLLGPAEAPSDR